jgi:hypothetical protein
VFQSTQIPEDFLVCILKLSNPEFLIFENRIFLKESFQLHEYMSKNEDGVEINQIQFWLNLTEISGIFEDIDETNALVIANILEKNWNLVISTLDKDALGRARVLYDRELGEVFITIDLQK